MTDKEKVVNGLRCCSEMSDEYCRKCPYQGECRHGYGIPHLANDALELLEEQEAEIEHLKRPDCEHAEHDGTGCLGYCGCTQDDEPIESCKRCDKYTGIISEAVKRE